MNKVDYIAWRNDPITREFLEVVVKEMDHTIADLITYAGDNSAQDKYRKGVIDGLRWFIEWVPQVEDDIDDTEGTGTPDSY